MTRSKAKLGIRLYGILLRSYPSDFRQASVYACSNKGQRSTPVEPLSVKRCPRLAVYVQKRTTTDWSAGFMRPPLFCEKWILHRFRKNFSTDRHNSGASARKIQKWLGHSSL
jgi:hypothetical protein